MNLAQRKPEELRNKLVAFTSAVDQWIAQRRKMAEFRIHRSQLDAIEGLLAGIREGIERQLKTATGNGTLVMQANRFEEVVLAGYQIWEFFRPKFAQRLEAQFRFYLRVADELAWACYNPVRTAVFGNSKEAKEPPLVYLNAGWSPFVIERNRQYQVEAVPRVMLEQQPDFAKALAQLPFPVIGVPWYQVGFLPGALTIAHEVGHAVEADYGITALLQKSVREAVSDPQRLDDWVSWTSEMFADIYGCMCLGPSFVGSLADTLAADRSTVDSETDRGYPPRSLRVFLNCAALDTLGFEKAAAGIRADWGAEYPPPNGSRAYEKDVHAVAGALLSTCVRKHSGKPVSLRKLVAFSPQQDRSALKHAINATDGIASVAENIRVLFAAVRHAYANDPVKFTSKSSNSKQSIQERLLDRLLEMCPDDLRRNELQVAGTRDTYLKRQGADLFESIFASESKE